VLLLNFQPCIHSRQPLSRLVQEEAAQSAALQDAPPLAAGRSFQCQHSCSVLLLSAVSDLTDVAVLVECHICRSLVLALVAETAALDYIADRHLLAIERAVASQRTIAGPAQTVFLLALHRNCHTVAGPVFAAAVAEGAERLLGLHKLLPCDSP
jgi:hypothetical protein